MFALLVLLEVVLPVLVGQLRVVVAVHRQDVGGVEEPVPVPAEIDERGADAGLDVR